VLADSDSNGKGKVTDEKEKIPSMAISKAMHRRLGIKQEGGKEKFIKKIIYYDSDSSSSHKDNDDSSYKKKTLKQNYSKMSFNYSRIPYNSNVHVLSIPLGKPPHFDGEDYSWWSYKMHIHLFSLHTSIWYILENGMHILDSDDENYNAIDVQEMIHKNAQATNVLLTSLCREEYNKVSGLDNAKEIWDTLKISHEGNDMTMITRMELIEGELGRFVMKKKEAQVSYNSLKTLVKQIRNYGSTRWMDHDVIRLMLWSFTVLDPNLVNLIRENPRYTKMKPEEILSKFVSGWMMSMEARYIDDVANGSLPHYNELQPIAIKATNNKKTLSDKVA
jgi:hypothetical protein